MDKNRPIAVFDSGVGGISVLKELLACMPNESYIYFGDSANAPYGSKTHEEIKELTTRQVDKFFAEGAKEVVIACNTATSVAIDSIRAKYPNELIIGVEPAIKPAVLAEESSVVAVMATPATLAEDRFTELVAKNGSNVKIIPIPCPKLAKLIEDGHLDDDVVNSYIETLLEPYKDKGIDSVVLGCTHYPFVRKQIERAFDNKVKIYDGAHGTALQAQRRLAAADLLADEHSRKKLTFRSSSDICDFMKLATKLLYSK